MGTTDIALERIFKSLIVGNVGMAITETEVYLSAWPNPQSKEKLDTFKQEYQLMTGYWQQGIKDPQQETQYLRLLQRVYTLCANISIHRHIQNSSYLLNLYSQARQNGNSWSLAAIRQEMEGFVSGVAMLELEPEAQRSEKSAQLYQQHHRQMNTLFNYVLTSNLWTDHIGDGMKDILLSPTIDSCDQQLIISAITLALMNRFDIVKFRLLVNVYLQAQDEAVRQRALVGWVMGIDDDFLQVYPEQKQLVATVLQQDRNCQELAELQIQLIYSLRVEHDTSTIQNEILPDMLKNSPLKMTPDGIKEVEDTLDDVLHPEAAEQRMSKLEESAQRMMDMQKQGIDVYFGGFSQMKRFPFFYDMSNWLVPFYLKHPDIANYVDHSEGANFLKFMLTNGPFCDSDKYSFVIAFHQVMTTLPDNMKGMVRHNGMWSDEAAVSAEEQHTPAYIRRMYLMNLYRFFRLFPNRSALCNPFDTTKDEMGMCLYLTSALFTASPMDLYKREIVMLLLKKGMKKTASCLLQTFPEEMRDVRYYLWTGNYAKALTKDPDNERALLGVARQSFNMGQYSEALDYYNHLLTLQPDKVSYLLNKAICLVQMQNYEDAQQLLFQLNYKSPDNYSIIRALAWSLTCDAKLDQAEGYYKQLMTDDHSENDDYLNYGYCLWLQGRIIEASDSFRKYVKSTDLNREKQSLFTETSLLKKSGITDVEIKMMESLVFS